jgi:hypothetical protein
MAKKRRIRKFVVTITVEEVETDHLGVCHQVPPPLQTRDSEELGWMEQQELRKRRRRRPANSE